MKKRKLKLFLAALLLLAALLPGLQPGVKAAENVRAADFTAIPALIQRLDRVLSGDVELYGDIQCSTAVRAPLNTRSTPLGKTYYVKSAAGNVYSGTSCYIYANAVYATLFGDVPCHGDDVGWLHSRRVAGNLASASYGGFTSLGVGFGALVRTTANSDGSYNGGAGHSLIVLGYDRQGITCLEGNADGKGLVRAAEKSWDAFNSTYLTGKGRRISFIVQPTEGCLWELASGAKREPVGYFTQKRAYRGSFTDVPAGAWFAAGVHVSYELGLLEGQGTARFGPYGTVTVAEAVAVCARFLSGYYADGWSFAASGVWYEPYYDYCRRWGINVDFAPPDSPISRADFAILLSRALPEEALSAGTAADFRDVPAGSRYAAAVKRLAASGVILGENGVFKPASTLQRAEMAQLLVRMADRSLRGK